MNYFPVLAPGSRWPKWFLTGLWGPALSLAVAYFLSLSAGAFPGGYDWRYEVMCRLGYPSVNPEGSHSWSAALALVCIMGLPCCGYFSARLQFCAPRLARFASISLLIGLLGGLAVALEGAVLPEFGTLAYKLHETVATVAFAATFFGVLAFWVALARWLRVVRGWSAFARAMLTLVVVVPLAGAMLSQAYLFFVPNDLGWVDPEWAAKGVPIWLSFAFWEWMSVAAFYASLYLAALLLPSQPEVAHGSPRR